MKSRHHVCCIFIRYPHSKYPGDGTMDIHWHVFVIGTESGIRVLPIAPATEFRKEVNFETPQFIKHEGTAIFPGDTLEGRSDKRMILMHMISQVDEWLIPGKEAVCHFRRPFFLEKGAGN